MPGPESCTRACVCVHSCVRFSRTHYLHSGMTHKWDHMQALAAQILFPQGPRTLLPESGGFPAFHMALLPFIHLFPQSVSQQTPLQLSLPWFAVIASLELRNPPPGPDAHRMAGLPPTGQPAASHLEERMLIQRCFSAAPEEKEHLGVGRPHPTCRGTLWSRRGCLGARGPSLFLGILSLGDTAFPCVHTTTWGGLDAEWNAAICGVGVGLLSLHSQPASQGGVRAACPRTSSLTVSDTPFVPQQLLSAEPFLGVEHPKGFGRSVLLMSNRHLLQMGKLRHGEVRHSPRGRLHSEHQSRKGLRFSG